MTTDTSPLYSGYRPTVQAAGGPVLCFDTSTNVASVALADAETLRHVTFEGRATSSESVVQTIAGLLEAGGLKVADLGALVVGVGPGSFTGIRVGMATAYGLSRASGVPLYGCSSLALLSDPQAQQCEAVILDARRSQFFSGVFAAGSDGRPQRFEADATRTADELGAMVEKYEIECAVGDASAQKLLGGLGLKWRAPRPEAARALWWVREAVAAPQAPSVTPSYLRLSEPEIKRLEALEKAN